MNNDAADSVEAMMDRLLKTSGRGPRAQGKSGSPSPSRRPRSPARPSRPRREAAAPGLPPSGGELRHDDDPQQLHRLSDELAAQLQPRTAAERAAVQGLARDHLRLHRVRDAIAVAMHVEVKFDARDETALRLHGEATVYIADAREVLAALRQNAPPRLPPTRAAQMASSLERHLRNLTEELAEEASAAEAESESAEATEVNSTAGTAAGAPAVALSDAARHHMAGREAREEARRRANEEFEAAELAALERLERQVRPARRHITAARIVAVLSGKTELTAAERRAWTALLEAGLAHAQSMLPSLEPAKRRCDQASRAAVLATFSHREKLVINLERRQATAQRAIESGLRQFRALRQASARPK